MKKTKRLISLCMAILMLVSLVPVLAFADDAPVFSVNPYGGAEGDIDTISWYENNGQYYLFLPSNCNMKKLTVYHNLGDGLTVGDKVVESGTATDAFAACGSYTLCAENGAEYTLWVLKSENVPAVYINTESGSLDYVHANKENKEAADIRIYDGKKISIDTTLKQIKGRGNATWREPKRPYNIKFDEKTKVLGMDKAKKWTLLASYNDFSIIRNPLTWYLADKLSIPYSSDYRVVDLFINGDYMGNYIICESVEVGKNRVNISDLEGDTEDVNENELDTYSKGGTGINGTPGGSWEYPSMKWVNIPNDPSDISGGYLLECDLDNRYELETSGFITDRHQCMVLKAPEYASKAQVKYIGNLWQEAEDAICSENGYNALGKHYSEYFDMESLVNMYILFELAANADGGLTSTYFYKDKGEDSKLVAAPAWDFDHAFAGGRSPLNWITNRQSYNALGETYLFHDCPTIFNRLFKHDDFRAAVSERWSEIGAELCGAETVAFVSDLANDIKASATMNGIRWGDFTTEGEYLARVNSSIQFLSTRKQALDKGFSANAAHLYYDSNDGYGWLTDTTIYVNGDKATVMSPIYDKDSGMSINPATAGLIFAGWNTKADGSGKTYMPGDEITLNGLTVLYAQWSDPLRINAKYGPVIRNVTETVRVAVNVGVSVAVKVNTLLQYPIKLGNLSINNDFSMTYKGTRLSVPWA